MAEFSDFTKLVLDRMDTNPEEFAAIGNNYTRWHGLAQGLEELARGDTEGRFIKVLWPLSDHERNVLLEKYRKIYLSELHKDMLKNIVSGNDKEQRTSQYVGKGLHPNSVITSADMKQQTLGLLNKAFDDSYSNAITKAEGAPVKAKFTISKSQHIIAKQMGISPYEYAQRLAKHEALDND